MPQFQLNKRYVIAAFVFCSFFGFSQNEAANWYFGQNAGLNFNAGFPTPLINGELNTDEGCSSISDNLGNLLFYSDGVTVWNKNHNIMQNGTGLLGNSSSTQSALIVPKPNSDTIFYIFTVDDRAGVNGLNYSEVNMSLNTGLGAVTANKNITLATPTTEKITAIENADGTSVWVISHLWNSNEFVSYLVSDSGVNTIPVTSAIGATHTGDTTNSIGYLKASPNREKIACVKSYIDNQTQIFDFNAATGILSNPITIANYSTENIGPYGCEFSPDSNLLYISETNRDTSLSFIHQYDLTQPTQQAIIDSDVIIAQENIELSALQQAIDGRIYVAKSNSNYLGVITDPNVIGTEANFISDGIHLNGKRSKLGLPPFIQSYFFATNIFNNTCFGDNTEFSINTSTVIDAIEWDFGDPASGSNNTSSQTSPTHMFSSEGEFTITITIDTEGETQIVIRTINISSSPPDLNLDPLIGCENDLGTADFDLQDAIPDDVLNDSNIIISYYESLQNAEDQDNPITNLFGYTNISNPQTIFIRMQNNLRGDCFNISEFELQVIENPIIEPTETVAFCSNTPTDFALIDVGELQGNLSDYSFLWLETQETSSQIEVATPGDYTVRITLNSSITPENPEGCFEDRIVTVIASGIATIDNILVEDGEIATIFTSGLGNYEYAIDDINGPYQISNVFSPVEGGLHTIYVRDINDCGISEEIFSVIGFPNFFTPNNDGYNDRWIVKGLSNQFQPNSKIYIFDRFGKLLKQLDPLGEGWDGTFNGEALPNNDYWFSVILQDGRLFVDHFTLKR